MKKVCVIKRLAQIGIMSITLVTGLIYNISCKQSDSEEPVTPYIINNSQSIVSTDIIDDQSRFSVLKASAGVEPTASFGLCVVGWSEPTPEQVAERTSLLFKAIESDNVEQAKLCIKTGADVNAKDNNGSTALYFANYKSKDRFLEPKEGIIAQLLAAGARE